MKIKYLLLLLLITGQYLYSQDKEVWKSKVSDLELSFSNIWKLIPQYIDTERKILIGIIDESDKSSIVVKITTDVPKEQLSDEKYYQGLKNQMLEANPENTLVSEDDIKYNGSTFHRLIFSMRTKYGNIFHTVYIKRDGTKITGIQISYSTELVNDPTNETPEKIQKVINNIKF